MQQDKDNQIVEGQDIDNRPVAGRNLLLVAALLISLPIYLLILFLADDPLFTGHDYAAARYGSGDSAGRSQADNRVSVKKTGGMNFSSVDLKPINSLDELEKAMVCTFELKSGESPQRVYLRMGSFERFSPTGMESFLSGSPDESWPDFAFSDIPHRFAGFTEATADLHFFCNFEERLPHVAPLQKLAGPLPFCGMRDGSIALEQTIAVGDEFEIGYLSLPALGASDQPATVAADSPYLSVDLVRDDELIELAGRIVGDTPPGVPTALKIAEFLESHGEYMADFQRTTDMHPVKEFLLKSMTGHCQHFSAALVLLCRLRGIPTRVATGFLSSRRRDNQFIFVDAMAHAWAEVLTEDGWKCLDVSPQRSKSPLPIAPSLALPNAAELADMKDQLKKENARRYAAAGKEAGSQVDATELAEIAEEPPRYQQQITRNQSFAEAQLPGTVVKESARTENHLKKIAERQRIKQEKDRRRFWQGVAGRAVPLILLAIIIWLITQNIEKWLKWLFKFKKKKASSEKDDDNCEEDLRESIAEMIDMSEFELQGKDVVDLFNRFTAFMETRGFIPRSQHETPGEYFDRICLELNLRPGEGKAAAGCFEAELYGGQAVAAADVKKFLHFLQQILGRLKQH